MKTHRKFLRQGTNQPFKSWSYKNLATPVTKIIMVAIMIIFPFLVKASGDHGSGQYKDKSKTKIKKIERKYEYINNKENNDADSVVGRASYSAMAYRVEYVFLSDDMQMILDKNFNKIQDDEIIIFVVINKGTIPHEFFIGDENEQKTHLQAMKSASPPDERSNFITVQPSETRELTWRFKGGSHVVFACNMPGHFEAGMFQKTIVGVR